MSEPSDGDERDDEIIEGGCGGGQEEIHERRKPKPGLEGAFEIEEVARRRERTRQHIAYILLALLGVLSVGSGAFLAVGMFTLQEMEQFLSQVFVPVVTLAGTALGFYFADRRD